MNESKCCCWAREKGGATCGGNGAPTYEMTAALYTMHLAHEGELIDYVAWCACRPRTVTSEGRETGEAHAAVPSDPRMSHNALPA